MTKHHKPFKKLAYLLKSGSFVAPVTFEEERQIGPSLGAEAIRQDVTRDGKTLQGRAEEETAGLIGSVVTRGQGQEINFQVESLTQDMRAKISNTSEETSIKVTGGNLVKGMKDPEVDVTDLLEVETERVSIQ